MIHLSPMVQPVIISSSPPKTCLPRKAALHHGKMKRTVEEVEADIHQRVPQGSKLGPFLFSFVLYVSTTVMNDPKDNVWLSDLYCQQESHWKPWFVIYYWICLSQFETKISTFRRHVSIYTFWCIMGQEICDNTNCIINGNSTSFIIMSVTMMCFCFTILRYSVKFS